MDIKANVTPHFKLGEFFVTTQAGGQDGLISDFKSLPEAKQNEIMKNITTLSKRLEQLREFLGNKSIKITSGWRSDRVNRLVGGKNKSYHLNGMAVDIVVTGMNAKQVQTLIDSYWIGGMGLAKSFTHLDTRPLKLRFTY